MKQPLQNLEQLLDHISELARNNDRVSMAMIVESIGSRSFGPMLMLIGIILFSPLSGVPGMATLMATIVLLVAIQMLVGRSRFWLPRFILERSVEHSKLHEATDRLRTTARRIDSVLAPRLTFLVRRTGSYGVAGLCLLVGLIMPFMELVPFSASIAGLAFLALGLALVVQDGLLVLFAIAVLGGVFVLIGVNLLG